MFYESQTIKMFIWPQYMIVCLLSRITVYEKSKYSECEQINLMPLIMLPSSSRKDLIPQHYGVLK